MSDLDDRLTAALNADPPPPRDAKFRLEVLLRIERERFTRRIVRTLILVFASAVFTVAYAAEIEAWIVTDFWRASIVALGVLVAMFSLSGVPIGALWGFKGFAHTLGRWLYPGK